MLDLYNWDRMEPSKGSMEKGASCIEIKHGELKGTTIIFIGKMRDFFL